MKPKFLIPMILAIALIVPATVILMETDSTDADTSLTTMNLSYYVGDTDTFPHLVKEVRGKSTPYSSTTSVISGNLPTGMTFRDDPARGQNAGLTYYSKAQFILDGSPTQPGTYVFTVRGETYRTIDGGDNESVDCVVTVTVQYRYFTVSYNANGGSVDPSSQTAIANTQITLPSATRDGYSFDGWYTASTGGTRVGGAGDSYTVTGDTILYAMWFDNIYENLSYYVGYGDPTDHVVINLTNLTNLYGGMTSVISGNLPTGMTFQDTSHGGVTNLTQYWYKVQFLLNGSPTQPGTYVFTVRGETSELSNPNDKLTVDCVVTVTVEYRYFTVSYNANGGSVDPSSQTVIANTQITLPTPLPSSPYYSFKGWYTESTGGTRIGGGAETYTVTGDITLYANWTENVTYWSNGNPNGSVSILYHVDDTSVTNDLITKYPLYRYDPNIEDDYNTEINESFVATGYYINVEIKVERLSATNYDAQAIIGLYDSNNNLIASDIYDFGKWGSFIIKVDTVNAIVSYTKVMQFRSFTDYQESVSGTILSYASYGDFSNNVTQVIRITPITDKVPRQQVIQTNVFLNTYGVVLRNPSLDVGLYFPELEKIRLNFYSFALYGTSITINGHTLDVTAPNITVYYKTSSNGNAIASPTDENVLMKSFELTNIYVTWDGSECYLTFANENFTIDMGAYTNKNISMEGMWYFATSLYEPYTATETSYDVGWGLSSFNLSTFGIILAVLLILGAIVLKATVGGRTLDYVIIICGTVIALIIAGGLINA